MVENNVHISTMLNGRFDFAINRYNQSVNNFLFPISKLSDLLTTKPQYGANESGIERKSFLEPRYIRITDIDEFGILNPSIGVTAKTVERKYFLENDDIIIARSGATVGKSYIYKKDQQGYSCFFAGYMIRFRVNTELVLPDYFFIYTQLKFYKQWTSIIQRTTGQPNINAEEYQSLKIPLPPKEIQQKIVGIYNRAVERKQAKEQEAKVLLESIDNYLSKELGIELPENTEKERYLKVNIQELLGGQLDVRNIRFKAHKRKSTKCDEILLSEISIINKGKSITKDKIIAGCYPVIAGGQTSPYSHSEYNEPENVITISASGAYSGYVWFHDYKIFASDCSVVRSKDETKYLTQYIYSILKLKQDEIYKMQRGAGQPHVYSYDVASMTIPVVSINKQSEIVGYISSVLAQAKQLREEADKVLAKTKTEIEKIIIGG